MPDKDNNIYKTCREAAGLTQERAAVLLNASVRNLARWESGEALPPDDIAYTMVGLYNTPFLAIQHLRNVSQVAASVLPAVEDCTLQTAALRLVNRVLSFADRHRDRELLQIAEDGRITAEERPLFDEILRELEGLVEAGTEVRLARSKEEQS